MTRSTLPASRQRALSTGELADLRGMLEEQRAFRIEQLMHLQRPGPQGPLGSTDPEILASLATGARAALRDVQAALWRMDDGSYGVCTACGHAVEVQRLEIVPQTAECMACRRAAVRG
jgi:RNA polymerase-binding transcription factor DksA